MSTVETSSAAGRGDLSPAGREALRMLSDHPRARVAALNDVGIFVPMPAGLPLTAGHTVIEEYSTALEMVVPADVRLVVDAWHHARDYGRARADVHPLAAPELTMSIYFLDTRADYGPWLLLIVGEGAERISDAHHQNLVLRPRLTVARQDEAGVFTQVDEAMPAILGYPDLVGRPAVDLIDPEDIGTVLGVWMAMVQTPGASGRMRCRHRHLDGHWVWLEVTLRNLLHDPAERCVVAEMLDISEEMAAHEHVVAQETLLRRLTESLPIGVVQVDSLGGILHRNHQADLLFGHAEARTLEELVVDVAPPDRPRLADATRAALDDVDSDVEISVVRGAGDVRRCQVILRSVPDTSGGASGLILCVSDVTEPARLRDQLHYRATYDPLTGCHNRASTLQELRRQLADAGADERGVGVLFIDLDGFKSVNDRRGHSAGDALLAELGRVLRRAVRAGDVVGRVGGDEFLIIHAKATSAHSTLGFAERVAAVLASSFTPEPPHTAVASIGVAWTGDAEVDPAAAETLVGRADTAMYRSKAAGDGRPVLGEPPG